MGSVEAKRENGASSSSSAGLNSQPLGPFSVMVSFLQCSHGLGFSTNMVQSSSEKLPLASLHSVLHGGLVFDLGQDRIDLRTYIPGQRRSVSFEDC